MQRNQYKFSKPVKKSVKVSLVVPLGDGFCRFLAKYRYIILSKCQCPDSSEVLAGYIIILLTSFEFHLLFLKVERAFEDSLLVVSAEFRQFKSPNRWLCQERDIT